MLSGAFIGFFVAIIILVIIYGYTAMRPVPPIDHDFGPDKTSFAVATPPDEAFKMIEGLPAIAKYKLGRADPQRRRVILQDGMTMKSYGYYYPVDIAPSGAGSAVTVGIKSKYPFQFGPIVRRQREKQLEVAVGDVKSKLAGTI
jgi:hypothetical protein